MTAPEDEGVRPYPRWRGDGPWSAIAVLATAAAGVVHVVAAGTHQSSAALHVGFFVLVGFAQLGLASAIAVGLARVAAGLRRAERSLRALLMVAVAGTVGLLALYLVVHSTDLLTGLLGSHEHGAGGGHGGSVSTPEGLPTEPPETLGTVGVMVELIALTAYTALLPRRWRTRVTDALLVLGALAWLLWFTGGIL
jgi:hypothetical protein